MSDEQQESQEDEPTMEEILSSIRRIISDDDQEESDGGAADEPVEADDAVAEEPMPQGEEDEVLDLTQMVNEDGSVTELDEDMVADPEPEPVAEEAEPELEDDFVLESEPDPEPDFDTASMPDMPDMDEELAAVEDTPPTAVDAGIVDKVTAQATAAALNQLVVDMPSYVGMGQGLSLEEIVKELLRPLLKEWLDQHLPGMAERLVQEEISRISRARQ
ncbi:MAG TPA: hypothetical protein DDW95_04910 [Alphaproteobacteria bacterium]|nr:hypothetical protein [Alphaproteobacteria bacterium]HAM48508.1 hypothetical protein [Alphaproteobacteria bacterium]HBA43313.1 hypothetical protein [Alphaproteobacteria bacterium]HBF97870.1 hypothetical protein [Alphaproteobacteria bacterium]HCO91204.1 hypothetical protein [Alphaproteobacteria bacterium]